MRHCFNIEIAKRFNDTNIATIFENLCFWIAHNKANNTNCHEIEIDGQKVMRTFTYNSTAAFCKLFPYWSKRQIDNYLLKLRENNLIIKDDFNQKGFDRTSWFCLADESWLKDHIAIDEKEQNTTSLEVEDTKKQSSQSEEETDITKQGNAFHQTGKCISPNGEMDITKQGNGYHQTGKSISPNGEMDTTKQGNAFHQTGKCISPNGEIDITKRVNGYHQTVKPIPDINSDINTTAATASLKAIFSDIDSNLVFDKEFYPAAVSFLHNYSVSDFSGYCKWLYGQVKAKDPKNFRGYYYKVFCLDDNILAYKASEKKEVERQAQEAKKQCKCPVCATCITTMVFACPTCGLDTQEFENEKEILKTKNLLLLPSESRQEYEELKNEIIQNESIKDYQLMLQKIEELDIKYGLIPEKVI